VASGHAADAEHARPFETPTFPCRYQACGGLIMDRGHRLPPRTTTSLGIRKAARAPQIAGSVILSSAASGALFGKLTLST
jgi:hypothetical protein